jgi:hypothetical protein
MCFHSSSVEVDSQQKDVLPTPLISAPVAPQQAEIPASLDAAAPEQAELSVPLVENIVIESVHVSEPPACSHPEETAGEKQVKQQLLYAMDIAPQFNEGIYSFQDSVSNNLSFSLSNSNGVDTVTMTTPSITMDLDVLKDFMQRLNAVAEADKEEAEEEEDAEDQDAETEAAEEDSETEADEEDAETEADEEDAEADEEDAEADEEDAEADEESEKEQKDDIVKIITVLVNSANQQQQHNMCMIQGLTNALVFACFTLFALSTLYVVTNRNTPA